MAKVCRIPVSCFTEHCLEVGKHYIEQTLNDEEKRKILDRHLESKHLLNENIDNEESIIRLTENNLNWIVLDGVEIVLGRVQMINKQIKKVAATGNIESLRKLESQLYWGMVNFFNWIKQLAEKERY